MQQIVWQPSPTHIHNSQMDQFRRYVNKQYGTTLADYPTLYQWSIEHAAPFWQSIWHYFDLSASSHYQSVLTFSHDIEKTRWFTGAKLNFAEHLLKRRDDHIAIIFVNEAGQRRQLTYQQLYQETAKLAQQLREIGIKTGDRVAGILPNIPETIIAMLAASSLGAIWSVTSPDFGTKAIVDRFQQIQPTVLIVSDGQYYGGKAINIMDKVSSTQQQLPSLKGTILVPYITQHPLLAHLTDTHLWPSDTVNPPPLHFTPLPFAHPLCILFSSGTTGLPKCMVHGAGGTLLQHLKELALHTNIQPHDVFFYYTSTAWMMWNWLASGLTLGTTLVLYDGAPHIPHPARLLDIVEQENVTVFGTSAKYLSSLAKHELIPKQTHHFDGLQTILSTGSPLVPSTFDYVYSNIKADICLSSISGGTDIVSCFALGNPTLPVYRGELQCRGLGMKVEVFNEQGQSVMDEKGELVCTAPFPSQPVYFWNDPEGKKYHRAYFNHFPNTWAHSDYAKLTQHGGLIIYGRSDTLLNPGGVRIGTAEIYRQVEKIAEVADCVAVGQQWGDDERIILFVILQEGLTLDDPLIQNIKHILRTQASPRHVPQKIMQVSDIPRTISGKTVELAVRHAIHGEPIENTGAIANPECLQQFIDREELK